MKKINSRFENLCDIVGITTHQAKENDITIEQLIEIIKVRLILN
jgi:hypothetical protein